MEKNKYIFISYAHKDDNIVLPIIKELSSRYNVWFDEGIDPGTEWDEKIAQHIEDCGFFIACMSKNYMASSNCKDELNFARDLDKNRLVVYLEEVELSPGMKMRINRLQNIHKYKYTEEVDFYNKLYKSEGISECLKEVTTTIRSDRSLYEKTLQLFEKNNTIRISTLQKNFAIGFSKAAAIISDMEEKGIIVRNEDGTTFSLSSRESLSKKSEKEIKVLSEERDNECFEMALQVVKERKIISISLLQRCLKIGYTKAFQIIDMMLEKGIIVKNKDGKGYSLTSKE